MCRQTVTATLTVFNLSRFRNSATTPREGVAAPRRNISPAVLRREWQKKQRCNALSQSDAHRFIRSSVAVAAAAVVAEVTRVSSGMRSRGRKVFSCSIDRLHSIVIRNQAERGKERFTRRGAPTLSTYLYDGTMVNHNRLTKNLEEPTLGQAVVVVTEDALKAREH